jgi:minor extracellular serine protease Vpr
MSRLRLAAALAASALVASSATMSAAAAPDRPHGNDDSTTTQATVDASHALVQLRLDPLATAESTRPPKGKKVDFSSQTVKSYKARLAAERNAFKKWLRSNAPQAKVTGEFDLSLNAVAVKLNGTSLDTLRTAPQVVRAEYEGLYRPTGEQAVDPDLELIHAKQAWGTDGDAGQGVKVAIIDTGIDITNPCFDDAGYDGNMQPGNKYTNDKVIVAKVFANKAAKSGYDAEAVQDHGTHVAGTVACNADTPATVDGVVIPYGISGVAPAAQLGNYNVFPGDIEDARSEDILNALDAAYADGMDIANMSLGGGAQGVQDLLTIAVDNLDEAGMVVAVAAGNSGPGFSTVESPGSAERALTAGASSVPHFVGPALTVGAGSVGLASGDFPVVASDLTAPVGVVTGATNGLGTACDPLTVDLGGDIAVISRGACTFSTKIRNAQDAGAVAAIVVNNVAGDPVAMAADGTPDQPTIPAYMASLADAPALVAADGVLATISAALSYQLTQNANIMAGFSSQGPTDVDRRVKPDVVAPGVNVLSSIPGSFCDEPTGCFAFFQGTSMATPHLAGSAAVVKAANPDWSAAEIRSAIVNTAQRGELTSYVNGTAVVTDPNIVGSGLEDLEAAVSATALLDPVSTSFGTIPSGSGQSRTAVVHVNNVGGSDLTAAVVGNSVFDVEGGPIPAGGEGDVTVSVTVPKKATAGPYSATLELRDESDTVVAHAVLYVLVG